MFQTLSGALGALFSSRAAKPEQVLTREDSSSFLRRAKSSMEQDFVRLEIEFQPAELDLSPLALPPEEEPPAKGKARKAPEKKTQPKKTSVKTTTPEADDAGN
jgi:hypothetical protein